MKPIEIDKLTQRRITMPAILVVGLVVLGWRADSLTVDYLDDFFITSAVAEEQYKQMTEQLTANTKVIGTHILTYELNENARDTRAVQEKLADLDLYVAANGINPIVTDRRAELSRELGRLGRVRACIIRKDPDENCLNVI